ncbi:glutathione S-transferase theta-3-like isoform X3 [Hypanus sabinus]|uniref:glutathione S-transferase theta-3-like isoform X3 n=1 Tax=Hypanus sabinus TaxID=79690 RepID=UPI0028C4445B|nr:glutathione S-transferase theta-3-like isoform X3 [Hypanus sabinus]
MKFRKLCCQCNQENIISLNSELKEAKWQIMEKSARLEKSQRKIIDLEARSRQNNIRIVGFEEGSETGDLLDYFANLFQSLFPDILPQPPDIGRANRIFTLKPRNPDKPRNFSQLAFSRIQVPPVFSVTNEAEIFILHQIGLTYSIFGLGVVGQESLALCSSGFIPSCAMDLELYLDLLSQPCRAVYIFAKKNNIAFDFKFVSLRAGQQFSEEFGKVNLLRRVPALKDGDFILAESVAILKYLAGKYRTPNHWYPSDLQLRARVDEYLAWQHTAIRFQGSRLFMFKRLLPLLTGQPIPKEQLDEAVEDLQSSIQLLEDKFLQDRPFIVGNEVSLADLFAIVELMQPVSVGFDPFADRPKLAAWRDRVKAALGKELFDEAHEQLMKSGEAPSTLDLQSPAIQRLAKNLKKRYK